MEAIEIETEIDENHHIQINVPKNWNSGKVKVIILRETGRKEKMKKKPLKLGLFRGKIQMSHDFNDELSDEFWLGGNP